MNIKHILVLVLVLWLHAQGFIAAQGYMNWSGDYVGPVPVKPDRAIVRFKASVSPARREAALRRETYVDPAAEVEDTAQPDTKIVRFVNGISPEEANAAILRLLADDHIEMASPIVSMVPDGHLEEATSEHFYMSFETPVAEAELRGILGQEGVEVYETFEYTKIQRKGFWMRCTEAAALHGLGMANRQWCKLWRA